MGGLFLENGTKIESQVHTARHFNFCFMSAVKVHLTKDNNKDNIDDIRFHINFDDMHILSNSQIVLGGTECITFLRQYIPLICFIIYNIFGALIICLMMCLILKEWIISCDTGDNKCWVFCIVRYLDITTRDC